MMPLHPQLAEQLQKHQIALTFFPQNWQAWLEDVNRVYARAETTQSEFSKAQREAAQAQAEAEALRRERDEIATQARERMRALEQANTALRAEIEERQRAETQWGDINAQLNTLIEALPVAVLATDEVGRIKRWNGAAERIFGWREAEVLGREAPMVSQDPRLNYLHLQERVLAGEQFLDLELNYQRRDAAPITVSLSTTPLYDEQRQLKGSLALFADVTARKQAEEALRASEQSHRVLIENMGEGLMQLNLNGVIQFVNARFCEMFGYTPHEVIGQNAAQLLTPFPGTRVTIRSEQRRSGATELYELQMQTKAGQAIWVQVSVAPLHDNRSVVIGSLSVLTDIQTRKQTELALLELHEKLQALVRASPVPIILLDLNNRVQLWSPAAEQVFGWQASEIVGQLYPLVPTNFQDEHLMLQQRIMQGAVVVNYETQRARRDGSLVAVSISTAPARDAAGQVVGEMAVIADISARKQAELIAQRTHEQRRLLLEIAHSPLSSWGRDEILKRVMDAIRSALPFDVGGFAWVDNEAALLRGYVVSAPDLKAGSVLPLERPLNAGIMGAVASAGRAELVNNAHWDPRALFNVGSATAQRHAMVIPIRPQGQTMGVVSFARFGDALFSLEEFELAQLFVSQCAPALENAQLYEQVKSYARQLELRVAERTKQLAAANGALLRHNVFLSTLHDISLDLLNRREENDLLQTIVDRAASLMDAPLGALEVLEGDALVVRASTQLYTHMIGLHIKRGEGLAGRVLETGQPLVVSDYLGWGERLQTLDALKLRAMVAVPILSSSACEGVLVLARNVLTYPFSDEELDVVKRFAALASLVLDNARLYTNLQKQLIERQRIEEHLGQQNHYLAALTLVSEGLMSRLNVNELLEQIATLAGQLLHTPHVYLDMVNLEEGVSETAVATGLYANAPRIRARPGTGLGGQAWQSGQIIAVDDYEAWAGRLHFMDLGLKRAVIAIPIKSGSQVLAVLGMMRTGEARVFTQDEIILADRFARLAALALDNARLYTTSQQQLQALNLSQRRLNTQYAMAHVLVNALTMEDAAPRILEMVCRNLQWDVGELWLMDDKTQRLCCQMLWQAPNATTQETFEQLLRATKQFTFARGEGLPGLVWQRGEAVWMDDVSAHPEFPSVLRTAYPWVRSAISFPIRNRQEFMGVIEFFSRGVHPYDTELRNVLTALGDQLGQFIERQRAVKALHENLTKQDYLLQHLVASGVAEHLMTQTGIPQLGGEKRELTILFADVHGYVNLAEGVEPEVILEVLNRHFKEIGRVIVAHGGTINQYAGDSLMAIFNAPGDQPDHALRAVKAGLAVQRTLLEFCQQELEADRIAMGQVGVGINTGPGVVGYLGFEDRFDYTAIGDTTNVAARLSNLAQSGTVLIGAKTHECVQATIKARAIGDVQLRGRSDALTVYEVIGEEVARAS